MSTASNIVLELVYGGKCHVRLMRDTDYPMLSDFELGFDHLKQLDKQWVWVAETYGKLVGVIMASPVHGIAMVWRLQTLPDQPFSVLAKLLRTFIADIRQRGYSGYMTLLNTNVDKQQKLANIVERTGGKSIGEHILMVSPLPKEGV